MSKYCPGCGTQLEDGVRFCPKCGSAQGAAPVQAQRAPAEPSRTAPAPGFSSRVNDPEILAALKKNRRSSGIFGLILVPLPLAGFLIYAAVSGNMEISDALKYGAIVSAVFLVFALIGLFKGRAKNAYDAVVTDKSTRRASRHGSDGDNTYYTEYVTVARTDDGKKKTIVEREGSRTPAWDYLPVGARFRYHPQFGFPYELYDKSAAPYIACVSCATKNEPTADRCKKCGIPLLK